MPQKTLAPDGAYSDNGNINGYCVLAQQRKEQFMRDARALLRQAGRHLARHGWTECELRVNPAGAAVSGDVSADYWDPANPLDPVYCTIGASAVAFGARKDGVAIMARKEKRAEAPNGRGYGRRTWMGINQWIDPGMNSQELAARLLEIGGLPEEEPARMLPGAAYHSRTAGTLVIPPAVVRNRQEAAGLKAAVASVIEAARADAGMVAGGQTVAEANGLRQMSLFEMQEI